MIHLKLYNTILNNRHSFKTRLIVIIVSDANKTVQVLELTVPNNTPDNIKQARERYQST